MFTISIAAARVNRNLSQTDVAIKMGVTNQTVSNWETGKAKISDANLQLLAYILETPLELIRRATDEA